MIAKYRDPEHPGKWWLTDFTMDQVEGRIANLESALEICRKGLSFLESQGKGNEHTYQQIRLAKTVLGEKL